MLVICVVSLAKTVTTQPSQFFAFDFLARYNNVAEALYNNVAEALLQLVKGKSRWRNR